MTRIAANKDLTIVKGDDFSLTFDYRQPSGEDLDFTGWTAEAQIRTQQSESATLIASFTITWITREPPSLKITLTDTVTGAITQRNGYWDLLLTDDSDYSETYVSGKVRFLGSVTEKA